MLNFSFIMLKMFVFIAFIIYVYQYNGCVKVNQELILEKFYEYRHLVILPPYHEFSSCMNNLQENIHLPGLPLLKSVSSGVKTADR
jgi:hypothetical protein